ncbi:MAG: phosphoribosylformylglycinamidine synthase subunit PurQ [Thermoguttaceae bacterium]|nr:phosphoribosylformylglycinamidine synthase subunit PurQ [Thermoguttaceae bacterium]
MYGVQTHNEVLFAKVNDACFKKIDELGLQVAGRPLLDERTGDGVADDEIGAPVTLTWNKSGVYTDRWANLEVKGDKCVFLRGVEKMYLPIAHAEGKFMARNDAVLDALEAQGRLVLRYAAGNNPNGATRDVAGICDETGRVFGLMPHPERHVDKTQRPQWTRFQNDPDFATKVGDGLQIFKNAVEFFN